MKQARAPNRWDLSRWSKGRGLVRYALGIDVGTSFTAADIWRSDDQQHKAEVVALSNRMPSVPWVLFLVADGSVVVV